MPNHHDWERADLHAQDNRQLRQEIMDLRAARDRQAEEIAQIRADSALVVYALDCSLQLSDALLTLLNMSAPEGLPLPPGIAGLKFRFDEAMAKMGREKAQR